MLSRSSTVAWYNGLRSVCGDKKFFKSSEQKKVEKRQRNDLAELLKIKEHFAQLLGQPELSEMETRNLLRFIFANYRIVGNKLVMRFKRIYAVSELTEEMVKKGEDEFEKRRRARLRSLKKNQNA